MHQKLLDNYTGNTLFSCSSKSANRKKHFNENSPTNNELFTKSFALEHLNMRNRRRFLIGYWPFGNRFVWAPVKWWNFDNFIFLKFEWLFFLFSFSANKLFSQQANEKQFKRRNRLKWKEGKKKRLHFVLIGKKYDCSLFSKTTESETSILFVLLKKNQLLFPFLRTQSHKRKSLMIQTKNHFSHVNIYFYSYFEKFLLLFSYFIIFFSLLLINIISI